MLICCQAGSLCHGKLWRMCAAWRKRGARDRETERQEVNILPGSTLITKQQRTVQQEAREETKNASEMTLTELLGWQPPMWSHVITGLSAGGGGQTSPLLGSAAKYEAGNQRTWMGRVKRTSSDLCVTVGLVLGPKYTERKNPKHPDDENKSYQTSRQRRHLCKEGVWGKGN